MPLDNVTLPVKRKSRRRTVDQVRLIAFDFETDPAEYEVDIQPFAVGIRDGADYSYCWGTPDEVVYHVIRYLELIDDPDGNTIAYAHNGGRFDFRWLLHACSGEMRILGGRILAARLHQVELRDSWGIIPEALGGKFSIDIAKLHSNVRDQHRSEILAYMRNDCDQLYDRIYKFWEEFGDFYTIGSCAMTTLRQFYDFEKATKRFDDKYRSRFYFGGRCQFFEHGNISGQFQVFDVNGMYQHVMREIRHPIGLSARVRRGRMGDLDTCDFATIVGENRGALPSRLDDGGISFDKPNGQFTATGHEIRTAIGLGLFEPSSVVETVHFAERMAFAQFIDYCNERKVAAELAGDEVLRSFYKRLGNSAYGKFAQNPDKYKEFIAVGLFDPAPGRLWEGDEDDLEGWRYATEMDEHCIFWRPQRHDSFFNVATGASITGAARAMLMGGMTQARRLVYCDTDSLVCQSFAGDVDPLRLGAWKHEPLGLTKADKAMGVYAADRMAVAGKKLYAMFDGARTVKIASKGVRLTGEQIAEIAGGVPLAGDRAWKGSFPVFDLAGKPRWVRREIRATGKPGKLPVAR